MLHLFGELIFPRRCAACQVEIDSGLLCDDCRNGLKEMRDFPPVDHLDGGLILFAYEGFIKQAIHKVKFFHDKKIPYLLAEEAELLLNEPRIRESMINFLKGAGILSYNTENYNKEENILRSRFVQTGLQILGEPGRKSFAVPGQLCQCTALARRNEDRIYRNVLQRYEMLLESLFYWWMIFLLQGRPFRQEPKN